MKRRSVRRSRRRRRTDKRVILTAVIAFIVITGAVIGIMTCRPDNDKPNENKPYNYNVLNEAEISEATAGNVYKTDEQRIFIESALSLTGRVHYFWGGKCYMQGEDPDWGNMRTVRSPGHSTTGTKQPYGLDCSGLISWCFIQSGHNKTEMEESIGSGTWNQWQKSVEINRSDISIGDLAFANRYPGAKGNHVGICVGFFKGEPVIAHCSNTEDNVVVTTCGDLFRYFRRPSVFSLPNS